MKNMKNDIFGKSLSPLLAKRLFLLDMDGTIYLDRTPIEGALDFLAILKATGRRAIFITNNSSRSVEDYVKKLKTMGIEASREDFFTSSMAMALFLKENHLGKRIYCMGTKSLIQELTEAGISVTTDPDDGVEAVVLGYDTELTYQKLMDVSRLLGKDLPYLATNPDFVCPVDFGYAPDCGAMAEMLWHATGKRPLFIGKPDPMIILEAVKMAGCLPENAVIIGDRLYTDIQSGLNALVTTVAVLSGETTREDIAKGNVRPDFVLSSVKDLAKLMTGKK
jgi:HAD superfamily hydrolase (TIGR01450 family)